MAFLAVTGILIEISKKLDLTILSMNCTLDMFTNSNIITVSRDVQVIFESFSSIIIVMYQ